jgi:REP element-mobilizing transposase RayT
MAIEQAKYKNRGIYFCTVTTYNWLPLIEETCAYEHIYHTFQLWHKLDVHIIGFVIMPNHFHFLVYIKDIGMNLAKLVGNLKRFLAYYIVKQLEVKGKYDLLYILKAGVKNSAKNKKHQVFKSSFDAKECYTDEFILQKLNYMHANPVKGKWKLVEDYRYYPYSSAGFYELGMPGKVDILSYRDI